MNKELFTKHLNFVSTEVAGILERTQYDSLLIHSGEIEYEFLDDRERFYKVNPQFNYFCPLTRHPNSFLYIKAGCKPQLFYYQAVDFWYTTPSAPQGFWVDSFDITVIQNVDEMKKVLQGKLANCAYIGNFPDSIKSLNPKSCNPQNVLHELNFIRAYKTPYEVACLKEANRLGMIAHSAAKDAFYQGHSEYEILMTYLQSIKMHPNELPYNSIVALNQNAATLHYDLYEKNRHTPENLHSFLLDAGASCFGYASDITRTYSYRKDEFQDIIDRLDKEQLTLGKNIEIGKPYSHMHLKSHFMIAEILKDFGFVNMPVDAMVEKGVTKTFYPHGLGHHLGLQVHDVGGTQKDRQGTQEPILNAQDKYLRSNRIVEENFVITMEPGLYFIDSLLSNLRKSEHSSAINWTKVDAFRKYGGIRIEDDMLIQKSGHINLTRG